MKTEINIWNGRGWNNYAGLRTLKSLKVGTRGLAARQGLSLIEVAPRDSDRPYGIAARYFNEDGDLIFTQGFDQNDSAQWIKDRVHALNQEGIQNRINARAAEISRAAFVKRITAWRRNFDAAPAVKTSVEKLSVKFHSARRSAASEDRLPSRKLCTQLAVSVARGQIKFIDAKNQIVAAGGIFA